MRYVIYLIEIFIHFVLSFIVSNSFHFSEFRFLNCCFVIFLSWSFFIWNKDSNVRISKRYSSLDRFYIPKTFEGSITAFFLPQGHVNIPQTFSILFKFFSASFMSSFILSSPSSALKSMISNWSYMTHTICHTQLYLLSCSPCSCNIVIVFWPAESASWSSATIFCVASRLSVKVWSTLDFRLGLLTGMLKNNLLLIYNYYSIIINWPQISNGIQFSKRYRSMTDNRIKHKPNHSFTSGFILLDSHTIHTISFTCRFINHEL